MKCKEIKKNINNFIKRSLNDNQLRKTYYHIIKCENCKEALLDEFSFYYVFNDLDNELNFNYSKKLDNIIKEIGNYLKNHDRKITLKYYLISIAICIALFIIMIIALRIVYC